MNPPKRHEQIASTLDDRRLEVETPEQVAVGFDLAGPGSRYAAFLVDGILLTALLLSVVVIGWLVLGGALASVGSLGEVLGPVLAGVMLLLTFVVPYGYFVYFEGVRGGQTPGKKYFNLRVVQDGGYPITLHGAVKIGRASCRERV